MIIKEDKYKKIRLLSLKGGGSSIDLLSELADYSFQNQLVTDSYKEALLKREEEFPTGILANVGIAIPHADQEYTKEECIIVSRLEETTVFKGMGTGEDVNVRVVFQLILNKNENQVKVLSKIVEFIQDDEKMNNLYEENAIDVIYNAFGQYL